MSLLRDLGKRIPLVGGQALLAVLVGYFTYHAIHGGRGLNALLERRDQVAEARTAHASLSAERQRIENKVQRLRRPSLDPDLLEEEAMKLLNLGHPDDYVIMLTPGEADR